MLPATQSTPGAFKMLAKKHKTSLIVAVCILVIGAALGRFLWPAIGAGIGQVIKQAKFNDIGGGVPAYTPNPSQSDEYNEYLSWLVNDVAKSREAWGDETVDRMVAILDARYTQEQVENIAQRPGATMRDQESYMYFEFTMAVIGERLRQNEPIEPEARRKLVLSITDALADPYARIRNSAISSLCYSRLVKDPAIRAKVVAMFNDPVGYIAQGARNGLDYFDEIERLRAEGKWHEPWIKD